MTHFQKLAMMLLLAWAGSPSLHAEDSNTEGPGEIRDTVGWHVVLEGETLQKITERYLGTPRLWRENWDLNPDLADPNVLSPGQRIQVILQREIPARQAEIERIANDVDKNLQQSGWKDASEGDRLRPLDGVRTRESSSAALAFDDGSSLHLTEESQVYLKALSKSVTGVRREEIEIVEGQADLRLNAPRPESVEVEIVVGSAITRPRVGPSGQALTRTRKPTNGGSQVMVYGGSSEVESGGRTVAVERGMGTRVPEGGPPADPEKLLPAPAAVTPARRSSWAFSNPPFAWRPVEGASSYTLEICRDPSCGRLVTRATDLDQATWRGTLPSGELYWRVTAISASGLDGFPSRPVPFEILADGADLGPPAVVAAHAGPGHVDSRGVLVLGRDAEVRLAVHDDASGVAKVRYRWNGGGWRPWSGRDLSLPAGDREHLLEVQATDGAGQVSPVHGFRVRRDINPPSPPGVEQAG